MTWAAVRFWCFLFLFFYMIWRLIRQGQILAQLAQTAQARSDERDAARLLMLEELMKAAARQEATQSFIASDLAAKNAALAHGVATKTAQATQSVEHSLETIKKQLDDNMDATVKAATASAEAVQVANNVNEKIATTKDDLVNKLEELFNTAKPHRRRDDV